MPASGASGRRPKRRRSPRLAASEHPDLKLKLAEGFYGKPAFARTRALSTAKLWHILVTRP